MFEKNKNVLIEPIQLCVPVTLLLLDQIFIIWSIDFSKKKATNWPIKPARTGCDVHIYYI